MEVALFRQLVKLLFLVLVPISVNALPVFPGAEGHGTETVAGSGRHLSTPATTVYKVTNLNDSGAGSLRECVEASNPRVCIFETSGTIVLQSRLRAREPYLTVAGQTAPAPGIMLTCDRFTIEDHDILIQHIAMRIGEQERCGVGTTAPDQRDNLVIESTSAAGGTYNVVIDHVSSTWGIDENISTYKNGSHPATDSITIMDSIIAEGFIYSEHSEPKHGMGLLIGDDVTNVSVLRNLFAHNNERNPRVKQGASVEVINNVSYNYGSFANGKVANMTSSSGSGANANFGDFIGNLSILGACNGTRNGSPCSPIIEANNWETVDNWTVYGDTGSMNSASRVFVYDNIDQQRTSSSDPQGDATNMTGSFVSTNAVVSSNTVNRLAQADVKAYVLANAGMFPANRQPTDTRIVNEVTNGTGVYKDCTLASAVTGCDANHETGDWDTLAVNTRTLTVPTNPDLDDDGDGWTNLEEWLHTYKLAVEPVQTNTYPDPIGVEAFADAEGFGKNSNDWRNSRVICDVNTDSDTGGAPTSINGWTYQGTLRSCLEDLSGDKIITFSGARNIALTDSIIPSDGSFFINGYYNNVQITCKGIDFDASTFLNGGFGRCISLFRETDDNDYVFSGLKIYPGTNTGTANTSSNFDQGGGALTLEDVEDVYIRNVTWGFSGDETFTMQGTTSDDGYTQNVTTHDVAFVYPFGRYHFPAHTICIVAFTYASDAPAAGDTMGVSYYRTFFTAGSRAPENKCYETELVNIMAVQNSNSFSSVGMQGLVKLDIIGSVFKGMQGYNGLPVEFRTWNAHTDRGNKGLNGNPNYHFNDNRSVTETFTSNGNDMATFTFENKPIVPRPTPIATRAAIGQVDSASILASSAIEASLLAQGAAGDTWYRNCDGTKNYGAEDKILNLARDDIRKGRSRLIRTEENLGGFTSVTGHTVCADDDGDFLPNAWEALHSCLNSNIPETFVDTNYDGYKNWEHYSMGTDPCA